MNQAKAAKTAQYLQFYTLHLLTSLINLVNKWAVGKSLTSSLKPICLEIIKRCLIDLTWTKKPRLKHFASKQKLH